MTKMFVIQQENHIKKWGLSKCQNIGLPLRRNIESTNSIYFFKFMPSPAIKEFVKEEGCPLSRRKIFVTF